VIENVELIDIPPLREATRRSPGGARAMRRQGRAGPHGYVGQRTLDKKRPAMASSTLPVVGRAVSIINVIAFCEKGPPVQERARVRVAHTALAVAVAGDARATQ